MIYLFLLIFLFVSAIAEFYSDKDSLKPLKLLMRYTSLFLLFFVAAFRFETGGDWPGYKEIYDSGRQTLEPLFALIVNISRLCRDYQYIFILSMIIRYICLHLFISKFCLKYVHNYSLILLIYYCMFFFHDDLITVRQSLAVGIFLLVFCKTETMNFKKYMLYVLAATCVHFSALVLIFLYPLIFRVSTVKIKMITIFILLLLFVFNMDVIKSAVLLLHSVLPSNYITEMAYQYVFNSTIGFTRKLTGTSYVYLFLLILLLFKRNKNRKPGFTDPFENCFFIFNSIYFGLINYFVIGLRLSMFFNLFVVLYVVSIIAAYFKKNILISIMVFVLAFAFNMNIFLQTSAARAYLPYQNYLIHKPLGLHSDGLQRLNSLESNDAVLEQELE